MNNIKYCPFLGVSYLTEPSVLRGGNDIVIASMNKCLGENCLSFMGFCGDGYCDYFERYTGHEKEGDEK